MHNNSNNHTTNNNSNEPHPARGPLHLQGRTEHLRGQLYVLYYIINMLQCITLCVIRYRRHVICYGPNLFEDNDFETTAGTSAPSKKGTTYKARYYVCLYVCSQLAACSTVAAISSSDSLCGPLLLRLIAKKRCLHVCTSARTSILHIHTYTILQYRIYAIMSPPP